MYARLVIVHHQPGAKEELIRTYRDSVVPAAQAQPGFQGAQLLTDRHADTAISVTYWESEAAMVAGETSGYYQEQIRKVSALFASPPDRQHYDVSVQV
jgi:heme-degrading monooxygenase HmoA